MSACWRVWIEADTGSPGDCLKGACGSQRHLGRCKQRPSSFWSDGQCRSIGFSLHRDITARMSRDNETTKSPGGPRSANLLFDRFPAQY